MVTWEDVQIAMLQKCFLNTGNTLVRNTSTMPYLNSAPWVANEALQLLSTAGKFIVKDIEITQNPITNILPQPLYMMNIYSHTKQDASYSANGGKAYYFEVDNTATVHIKVGGIVAKTINNAVKGKFTAYKGFVPNPSSLAVEIVFSGPYPYNYRNIALYEVDFESVDDIWDYVSEKRYDLKELAPDFYKLNEIIYQAGFNEVRYEKTTNYHFEGDSVLVLGGMNKGAWKVVYYAYPQQITKDTPGETVLSLDPEIAALLPLYMASQLYKDDDISLATQWRNEFEVARELLAPTADTGRVEFQSESGW